MNPDHEPMTCDRLRELLVEHVDGLLGAAEAGGARAHLAACAGCRLLQEEVRRNFAAMDAWEDEEIPEGAWDRLEARLHAGPAVKAGAADAPSRRRSWLRLAIPYAAGLSTAAAAAFVFFFVPWGSPTPPAPLPGKTAPAVLPADPVADGSPVAEEVAPALARTGSGESPALRPGENRLRFDDADHGVVRTLELPRGVDPRKVMLVDTPPVVIPRPESEVR